MAINRPFSDRGVACFARVLCKPDICCPDIGPVVLPTRARLGLGRIEQFVKKTARGHRKTSGIAILPGDKQIRGLIAQARRLGKGGRAGGLSQALVTDYLPDRQPPFPATGVKARIADAIGTAIATLTPVRRVEPRDVE